MIDIIPAVPSDLDQLELKEIFEHKDALVCGKAVIRAGNPAFSIIADLKVIGVFGGTYLYPGVMEVFGLFSEEIKTHRFSFHKACLELVKGAFEKYNVHRLQIVVRADYREGQKWANVLGFLAEGTLRKFGPDKHDYIIYGRVI